MQSNTESRIDRSGRTTSLTTCTAHARVHALDRFGVSGAMHWPDLLKIQMLAQTRAARRKRTCVSQ